MLGNHDFESDAADEVTRILGEAAGVVMLDGTRRGDAGGGIRGRQGFPGGFGARALQAWGEAPVKAFVADAIEEALKLESALARLRTPGRVAVLHYAPIGATVDGEPIEIYPFLGSSRLEEPINRYRPDVVFHGHAHRGQLEGATSAGVPVYNVALPLLRRSFPEQPFRVIEIAIDGDERAAREAADAPTRRDVRGPGMTPAAAVARRRPARSPGCPSPRAASIGACWRSSTRADSRSWWAAGTRSSATSASAAR